MVSWCPGNSSVTYQYCSSKMTQATDLQQDVVLPCLSEAVAVKVALPPLLAVVTPVSSGNGCTPLHLVPSLLAPGRPRIDPGVA